MADKVEIEIPGIGKITAENAATEATLQDILKVLQGTQKSIDKNAKDAAKNAKGGKSGSGADGSDGGKSMAATNKAAAQASKGLGAMAQAGQLAGKSMRLMGYAAATGAAAVSGLAAAGGAAAGATMALGKNALAAGESMTDLIERMAAVGDSTVAAANALRVIPGVGGILANVFGAVAGAVEGVVGSYQKAAAVGATFNGSVDAMSRAAGGAGMTLDQFAGVLHQNAESLMLLGGTTEQGAKQFALLAKDIQNSGVGSELQRLGYTTEQINGGMARYIGMLGKTGALQGMSSQQLVASSGAYLKELDALAKITGVSREEKEKEQAALLADAKVRAAMAGLDADQQRQMMAYITSFPKEQQAAIADMIATGNTTTDEAIQLQSMLPGVAAKTMEFGRTLQAGGKINQDALNQAKNSAVLEAQDSVKRNKMRGMYDEQAGKQFVGMANLAAQKVDGYSQAIGEQGKAAAKANLAENLTKAKQRLAEFSNNFQMALANSGMLDSLMKSFETLANFTMQVIVPLFNVFAQAVNAMIPVVVSFLVPALKALGEFVQNSVVPGFMILGNWITTAVVPIFKEAYKIVSNVVGSLFDFLGVADDTVDGLGTFEEVLYTISDFIEDNLQEVLIGFGILMGTVLVGKIIAFGASMMTTLAPIGSFVMGLASATFNLLKMAAQLALSTVGFLIMNPPILAVVAAVGLLVYGFKKMGGDMTVLTDAFKWAASWASTLFLKLQFGIYSLLNKIPGMRGDFDKDLQGISKQMDENETERAKLEDDMAARRKANIQAEKDAEAKKIADEKAAKNAALNQEEADKTKAARRAEEREARKARREQDAIKRKEEAELSAIDKKEEREKSAEEAKNVTVDLSDPIQMLKTYAAQQKSAYSEEAKALDDQEKARSQLKMASESYANAIAESGKARTDEERKAAEAKIQAAKEQLDKASKAESETKSVVDAAAKRMAAAQQGKDPGPTAAGSPTTAAGGAGPATSTATPKVNEGAVTEGVGNLYQQTQEAINKGIKYGFGSKDLKTGAIDCSGWIANINTNMMNSINKEAGKEIYGKEAKKAFQGSAADIIKNVSAAGGGMLEGGKNIRANLKEGMLIGEDNGDKGWDAGRHKGIDHITQTVKDPKTGKLMISESQGGKGVTLTDPEEYFKKKEAKGVKLYGTDMTAMAKDAEGRTTAPPSATANIPKPEDAAKARTDAARNDPRRTDRVEGEVKNEGPQAGTLQSLIQDGITPTTMAFQELINKGIKPFQSVMSSGIQIKTPLGQVPAEESLSPGEEIVSKSNISTMIEDIKKERINLANNVKTSTSVMPNAESAKAEIVAQAEKAAAEKEQMEKEQAEFREKLKKEEAMAMSGPTSQEGALSGSSDLNTALAELIAISRKTADLNEKQLSVQSSLSGDLFA